MSLISAGADDALITDDGALYILKYNSRRGLIKVETFSSRIIQVSVGKSIGCAQDESGFVWCWGQNSNGELGLGDTYPHDLPAPVLALKGQKISQISTGGQSVICLGKT